MTRFLGEIPDECAALEDAAAVVIPVPYDGTSTYIKGADKGPGAMLRASAALEWYDIETGTEPHLRGIATLDTIEHPDGPEGDPVVLAGVVQRAVGAQMDAGRVPVVLGGEHSVSIGAIRAAAARREGLTVVQIDAHGDTRETWEGSDHNHACVMARAREVASIVQVGIRSIDAEEVTGMSGENVLWAHEIRRESDLGWTERVADLCGGPVYFTIDLDAFDPSIVPATGTPEPGGLLWHEVTGVIDAIVRTSEVVGFDVVELCPMPGQQASEFLAAKLVHTTLARILARR